MERLARALVMWPFRLFLRCADRRWLLWQREEQARANATGDYEARWRHLALNRPRIQERVKERSEEAMKRLCGQPLPSSDLAPWKRVWRLWP